MHEWALAEGVITTALKAASEQSLNQITKIEVVIGELQQIEREILEFALKEVMPANEPRLAETTIDLIIEPAVLRCRSCQHEFTFAEAAAHLDETEAEAIHFIPEMIHTYVHCSECQSPDFDIVKGRGVWIASVEGS